MNGVVVSSVERLSTVVPLHRGRELLSACHGHTHSGPGVCGTHSRTRTPATSTPRDTARMGRRLRRSEKGVDVSSTPRETSTPTVLTARVGPDGLLVVLQAREGMDGLLLVLSARETRPNKAVRQQITRVHNSHIVAVPINRISILDIHCTGVFVNFIDQARYVISQP